MSKFLGEKRQANGAKKFSALLWAIDITNCSEEKEVVRSRTTKKYFRFGRGLRLFSHFFFISTIWSTYAGSPFLTFIDWFDILQPGLTLCAAVWQVMGRKCRTIAICREMRGFFSLPSFLQIQLILFFWPDKFGSGENIKTRALSLFERKSIFIESSNFQNIIEELELWTQSTLVLRSTKRRKAVLP